MCYFLIIIFFVQPVFVFPTNPKVKMELEKLVCSWNIRFGPQERLDRQVAFSLFSAAVAIGFWGKAPGKEKTSDRNWRSRPGHFSLPELVDFKFLGKTILVANKKFKLFLASQLGK